MSVSPSTVVDIALLALGASITTRIQRSLPLAAASRVEVEITLLLTLRSLGDHGVDFGGGSGSVARSGRTVRGIGAEAATTLARSTGEEAAGA